MKLVGEWGLVWSWIFGFGVRKGFELFELRSIEMR